MALLTTGEHEEEAPAVETTVEQPAAEEHVERTEEPKEPTRAPSVADTVKAAFEVVEDNAEKQAATDEGRAERKRDPETGQFLPSKTEKRQQAAVVKTDKAVATVQGGQPMTAKRPGAAAGPPPRGALPATETTDQPPVDPTGRAPQAWRALAREAYAKLDKLGPEDSRVIREELHRREREVNQRLSQDAPARELARAFQDTVQPFVHLIPPGKHPLQSIQGLMQTAAALQTGSPQQRAVIAANIIRGYGVDIDMLAAALDGQQVPGQAGQTAQGAGYDPRVDQLWQMLQERDRKQAESQRAQEAAELAEIRSGYEKFAETHEFFEDVREEMADIINLSAARGVPIDDETAYTRAVAFHPELAQLVRQRELAGEATNPQGSTARARAAAVSVKPAAAARSSVVSPTDLRGTVAAAFEKAVGRG
jgi:hypothetical protein